MMIDNVNSKIMIALSKNGRYSYAKLAKELGIKETTVASRIGAMLKDDVFTISAVPNPTNMGYKVMAVVTLDIELSKIDAVCNKLVDNPNISSMLTTFGRFDAILFVEYRELENLYRLVKEEIPHIDGVRGIETLIISELKKRYRPSVVTRSTPDKRVVIDKFDEALIQELRKNGRATYTELANKLGISPATVSRRVASLIRNNVFHITIVPNPSKLDRSIVAYVGLKVDLGRINDICTRLASYEQIPSVMTLINGYDILAIIASRDFESLYQFIVEEIALIEGVFNVESLVRAEFKKRTYLGFDIEQRLRQRSDSRRRS